MQAHPSLADVHAGLRVGRYGRRKGLHEARLEMRNLRIARAELCEDGPP